MSDMRVQFPGYVPEKRGGRTLHRVRVKGNAARRVTIPVGPEDPQFSALYHAARRGENPEVVQQSLAPAMSLDALVDAYLDLLESDVRHGQASRLTLRQRKSLLKRACDMPDDSGTGRMGALHCDLPPAALRHIIAQWGARTAQADNTIKALRAAYDRMDWLDANPCVGIKRVHRSKGGTTPWSTGDVQAFMKAHPQGTSARVWLMLALFTGARLSDLAKLGRANEVRRDGMTWIEWQPSKRGSSHTSMPMAPQLAEAVRATGVIGRTYILNQQGQPFANGPVLAERVRRWTADAGLERRSSHGLRKALGGILADAGATEHQIMSVLSHASPTTSAIYTKSAQRARLAGEAMASIRGLDFG